MPKTVTFDTVERDGANTWIHPDGTAEVELVYHLKASATGERSPQRTRRFTTELDSPFNTTQLPPNPTYADAVKLIANNLLAQVTLEEGV